jgi:hypothetical protein
MKIDDFKQTLNELEPGNCAAVPYEIFDDLFPPGVEDDRAKVAAYAFAKVNGCTIDHRNREKSVYFVKAA